ncbi:hypothetical protein [Candidatus Odyssella thessalonicensis]|uniref:hypothetical protein n=1 Tax=Candidatus Odyssella thessalonicensis TaxID=84647 RepID=UPI000225AC00|nr:hypothetical protein [Candidatus Odyssella thessalonicensis]
MHKLMLGMVLTATLSSASEPPLTREVDVEGISALEIQDLAADVEITTLNEEDALTTVKLQGSESVLDQVDLQIRNTTFVISISQKGRQRTKGIQGEEISGNGDTVNSSHLSVPMTALPHLTITVPRNCMLSVLGARGGAWTITHSYQPVHFSLNKGARFKVNTLYGGGTIRLAEQSQLSVNALIGETLLVHMLGASRMCAQNIDAQVVNLSVNQESKMVIHRGDIEHILSARICDAGEITFNGKATNASLSITDTGSIAINNVINFPVQRINGKGRIIVNNWPQLAEDRANTNELEASVPSRILSPRKRGMHQCRIADF